MQAFKAHGIKSITMDDIALSLGISKRTLYEVKLSNRWEIKFDTKFNVVDMDLDD